MEKKPGTPEPDKKPERSDEDDLEDLEAPAGSQAEVAGGCISTCMSTCVENTKDVQIQ